MTFPLPDSIANPFESRTLIPATPGLLAAMIYGNYAAMSRFAPRWACESLLLRLDPGYPAGGQLHVFLPGQGNFELMRCGKSFDMMILARELDVPEHTTSVGQLIHSWCDKQLLNATYYFALEEICLKLFKNKRRHIQLTVRLGRDGSLMVKRGQKQVLPADVWNELLCDRCGAMPNHLSPTTYKEVAESYLREHLTLRASCVVRDGADKKRDAIVELVNNFWACIAVTVTRSFNQNNGCPFTEYCWVAVKRWYRKQQLRYWRYLLRHCSIDGIGEANEFGQMGSERHVDNVDAVSVILKGLSDKERALLLLPIKKSALELNINVNNAKQKRWKLCQRLRETFWRQQR